MQRCLAQDTQLSRHLGSDSDESEHTSEDAYNGSDIRTTEAHLPAGGLLGHLHGLGDVVVRQLGLAVTQNIGVKGDGRGTF